MSVLKDFLFLNFRLLVLNKFTPSLCLCSKVTGGGAQSDCQLCDLGHYCNGTGKTDVTDVCAPGYHCLRGAKIPKPNNDSTGGICPRGHFCAAGGQPEKCAPGT